MTKLNQVILQGNLVDDPKIMGSDNNVARFTIAVNNGFGEYQTTTFVDCVAFKGQAEVIGKYFTKGKEILIRGTLEMNRWKTDDGQNRSKLEVRLENVGGFYFTGNKGNNSSGDETAVPEEGQETQPLF
jgi:single-strand DNA-binding protein